MNYTNAKEFKSELEHIFIKALSMQADVTADQLLNNGAISYLNGKNGTVFDFITNGKLPAFASFYEEKPNKAFTYVSISKTGEYTAEICNKDNEVLQTISGKMDFPSITNIAKYLNFETDAKFKFNPDIEDIEWDFLIPVN